MSELPWREEWTVYRVRCDRAFEDMLDEAAFSDELADIGGFYVNPGPGAVVVVICVDRDGAEARREAVLAAMRRQGLAARVEEEGRGFARRQDLRLVEYRLEVGAATFAYHA